MIPSVEWLRLIQTGSHFTVQLERLTTLSKKATLSALESEDGARKGANC